MPLKPLERKKNSWSNFLKLIFLIILMIGAFVINKIFLKTDQDFPAVLGTAQKINQVQNNDFIKDSIKKVEDVAGTVLGKATDTVDKLASDTGSYISNIIYDSSIGKIVEQVDKLPKDQQEKIRERICR